MKIDLDPLISTDRRLKLKCRMVDTETMFHFWLQQ
jgi:hypothetical protein